MNNLYPIYLNLEQRVCLVVGGGQVAERKIGSLLESRAKVKVVSPEVTPRIWEWSEQGHLVYHQRDYCSTDLNGALLVFAATNNATVNHQVTEDCRNLNIPVNVVDDPDNCNFFVPSVIRRGKLTIAVSTSGASPALAAKIRRQLAKQFGPEYSEWLEILANLRRQVLAEVTDSTQRKHIFDSLAESDILELLKAGEYDRVKERIHHAYRGYRG